MSFFLVAHHVSENFTGEISRAKFENLDSAILEMESWALHGVDSYCSEAHHIGIYDSHARQVYIWNWSSGRGEEVIDQISEV